MPNNKLKRKKHAHHRIGRRRGGCVHRVVSGKAGHQVTVIDRAEAAAMETSFANAGQLSYGYTTPWAAPGIPQKALKWLFRPHSPLIFKPDGSLFQLRWLWQMLANCNEAAYHLSKERMVRISEYSRALFNQFEAETGMGFEARHRGTVQIFRSAAEVAASAKMWRCSKLRACLDRRLRADECADMSRARGGGAPIGRRALICPTTAPATAIFSPPAWRHRAPKRRGV